MSPVVVKLHIHVGQGQVVGAAVVIGGRAGKIGVLEYAAADRLNVNYSHVGSELGGIAEVAAGHTVVADRCGGGDAMAFGHADGQGGVYGCIAAAVGCNRIGTQIGFALAVATGVCRRVREIFDAKAGIGAAVERSLEGGVAADAHDGA